MWRNLGWVITDVLDDVRNGHSVLQRNDVREIRYETDVPCDSEKIHRIHNIP